MRQIASSRRRDRLLQQIASCDKWKSLSLQSVARIQTGLNACDRSQRQNKRKQPCRSTSADEAACRSDLSHSVSRPQCWTDRINLEDNLEYSTHISEIFLLGISVLCDFHHGICGSFSWMVRFAKTSQGNFCAPIFGWMEGPVSLWNEIQEFFKDQLTLYIAVKTFSRIICTNYVSLHTLHRTWE